MNKLIMDPVTEELVHVKSIRGKNILKKYKNEIKKGGFFFSRSKGKKKKKKKSFFKRMGQAALGAAAVAGTAYAAKKIYDKSKNKSKSKSKSSTGVSSGLSAAAVAGTVAAGLGTAALSGPSSVSTSPSSVSTSPSSVSTSPSSVSTQPSAEGFDTRVNREMEEMREERERQERERERQERERQERERQEREREEREREREAIDREARERERERERQEREIERQEGEVRRRRIEEYKKERRERLRQERERERKKKEELNDLKARFKSFVVSQQTNIKKIEELDPTEINAKKELEDLKDTIVNNHNRYFDNFEEEFRSINRDPFILSSSSMNKILSEYANDLFRYGEWREIYQRKSKIIKKKSAEKEIDKLSKEYETFFKKQKKIIENIEKIVPPFPISPTGISILPTGIDPETRVRDLRDEFVNKHNMYFGSFGNKFRSINEKYPDIFPRSRMNSILSEYRGWDINVIFNKKLDEIYDFEQKMKLDKLKKKFDTHVENQKKIIKNIEKIISEDPDATQKIKDLFKELLDNNNKVDFYNEFNSVRRLSPGRDFDFSFWTEYDNFYKKKKKEIEIFLTKKDMDIKLKEKIINLIVTSNYDPEGSIAKFKEIDSDKLKKLEKQLEYLEPIESSIFKFINRGMDQSINLPFKYKLDFLQILLNKGIIDRVKYERAEIDNFDILVQIMSEGGVSNFKNHINFNNKSLMRNFNKFYEETDLVYFKQSDGINLIRESFTESVIHLPKRDRNNYFNRLAELLMFNSEQAKRLIKGTEKINIKVGVGDIDYGGPTRDFFSDFSQFLIDKKILIKFQKKNQDEGKCEYYILNHDKSNVFINKRNIEIIKLLIMVTIFKGNNKTNYNGAELKFKMNILLHPIMLLLLKYNLDEILDNLDYMIVEMKNFDKDLFNVDTDCNFLVTLDKFNSYTEKNWIKNIENLIPDYPNIIAFADPSTINKKYLEADNSFVNTAKMIYLMEKDDQGNFVKKQYKNPGPKPVRNIEKDSDGRPKENMIQFKERLIREHPDIFKETDNRIQILQKNNSWGRDWNTAKRIMNSSSKNDAKYILREEWRDFKKKNELMKNIFKFNLGRDLVDHLRFFGNPSHTLLRNIGRDLAPYWKRIENRASTLSLRNLKLRINGVSMVTEERFKELFSVDHPDRILYEVYQESRYSRAIYRKITNNQYNRNFVEILNKNFSIDNRYLNILLRYWTGKTNLPINTEDFKLIIMITDQLFTHTCFNRIDLTRETYTDKRAMENFFSAAVLQAGSDLDMDERVQDFGQSRGGGKKYDKIQDPINKKFYKLNSKKGQKILKKYLKYINSI